MTKARSNATAPNAKGTLVVGNGTDASTTLAVASTAGYLLTVDSAEATGLKWAAPSGASFVGCRLTNSANQSINNTTVTAITFDTETFDTDGFHSTVSNTSRITIPSGKGGKYLVFAMGMFVANTTGRREFNFRVNGSSYSYHTTNALSSGGTWHLVSTVLNLSATDYVELMAWQNSGGALIFNGDLDNYFGCAYLGA